MSEEILESRLERLKKMEKEGINPYPHKFETTHTLKSVREGLEFDPEDKEVILKGKIKRVSKKD
ncbi:MAG: lysine--tRNA ligase, partial [Sulfurihydrogenibium azorense]